MFGSPIVGGDSLKYCRHEEKKKKETELEAGRGILNTIPEGLPLVCARVQIWVPLGNFFGGVSLTEPAGPPGSGSAKEGGPVEANGFCQTTPPKFLVNAVCSASVCVSTTWNLG